MSRHHPFLFALRASMTVLVLLAFTLLFSLYGHVEIEGVEYFAPQQSSVYGLLVIIAVVFFFLFLIQHRVAKHILNDKLVDFSKLEGLFKRL